MRKLLIIGFLFVSIIGKSQVASICVQHYCNDSVFNPINSLPLVAKNISSTFPIASKGWIFVSGPTAVTVPAGDSVWVTLLGTGNYQFKYSITDTKGNNYTGFDNVAVIPLTVVSTKITYIDSTSVISPKPIAYVTKTYSNGTTQITVIP